MAAQVVSFSGFKEFQKDMELYPKVTRKAIRQSLTRSAKKILATAQTLVPVDTGELRESLKVSPGKRQRSVIKRIIITQDPETGENKTWYGLQVEYGHALGARALGDSRYQIPPQPFMRPAYDQQQRGAIQDITDSVAKAMRDRR